MEQATFNSWTLVIQAATAIGTLLLAALAIWGPRIQAAIAGPRLQVTLHQSSGDLTHTNDGSDIRYYHLEVRNHRPSSSARAVRVVLTRVVRFSAGVTQPGHSLGSAIQLTWVFPRTHAQFPNIPPDDRCDLGCIAANGPFAFSTYLAPNNVNLSVGANERAIVEVMAIAENAQSKPLLVEVAWDGKWSLDSAEMSRHLVVKEAAQTGV